jgi:hypothetical protein
LQKRAYGCHALLFSLCESYVQSFPNLFILTFLHTLSFF